MQTDCQHGVLTMAELRDDLVEVIALLGDRAGKREELEEELDKLQRHREFADAAEDVLWLVEMKLKAFREMVSQIERLGDSAEVVTQRVTAHEAMMEILASRLSSTD